MKKYIITSFVVIISILSCKKNGESQIEKNVVQKNLPSFEKLYSFINNQQSSGKFMINATSPLGWKDVNTVGVTVSGAFINKATQKADAGQTNFFNGLKVEPQIDKGYNGNFNWQDGNVLFGSELKLKLTRGTAAATATAPGGEIVANFKGGYSPQVFMCSNSFPDNVSDMSGNYISGLKLKPTYKFDWNKDSLNKNGVFVYIEYDPKDPSNEKFLRANPSRISNAIIVDDIGTYTLASDLFTDFPLNCRLRVYIGRGNFQYIAQPDGTTTDMQITTLSYQHGEFFYKTN
jgi:hypothetical protein